MAVGADGVQRPHGGHGMDRYLGGPPQGVRMAPGVAAHPELDIVHRLLPPREYAGGLLLLLR